ncbi:MAG: c-type cytochrome [Gammaproteobacteria bacterium]|nr:c-type cytochrome [Gammaproteobacteria bacterium]
MVLLPMAAQAADAIPFIPVKWSAAEPMLDPASPNWLKQPATTVSVYPQTSVPPVAAQAGAATVKVRAQYGARTVALHLEWADDKPAKDRGVGQFADGAAVQWPVRYGSGVTLPYIGMGHGGTPVALWFWRGDGSVETLAAEGFGTLSAQPPDGVKAKGVWKDGTWRVVFVRTHSAPGEHRVSIAPAKLGLVPVAFAVWSGDAAERNGFKRLSAWQVLRFEKGKVDAAYEKQLGEVAAVGDAERGKRLMSDKGCAGCHSFPANPAQPRIGPDLTYAGGIHSASYLTESLLEPSRVVVPGKGYFMEQDGKRTSLMPPFTGTEAERNDILAYLMSLRGQP